MLKIKEKRVTLLFTEKEWNDAMPDLTNSMAEYLRPYRSGVFESFTNDGEEWGEGWGSGSYLRVGETVYVLTNKHVSSVIRDGRKLAYQFDGQDDIRLFARVYNEISAPFDLGLLPVAMSDWDAVEHSSKAITVDQIALAHVPVESEVLAFSGFAGQKVSFNYNQLNSQCVCSLSKEIDVPEHPDINPRFHFALDYNPNLATSVIGNTGLPTPPGFSGSTVWDTGFVRAKMMNEKWTPEMARVTGVVWGWPSCAGSIIATRAEYVRSFLLGVVAL
ncbi:hypothetical protein FSC46_00935 [Pseudomonas aeruginosa]|nr:hypothetical protein FSC46_00935 [Pseudomonas aeruginosa]